MKRSRDDNNDAPNYKLSFGHSRRELQPECRGESRGVNGEFYGDARGGRGNGNGNFSSDDPRQKLSSTDALTYLREVRDMFQNQNETYSQFLDIMKGFKAQSLNTDDVIEKVQKLFKGHISLIHGFNTFLPKGYEIKISSDDEHPPKKTVERDKALSFVRKLKKRFRNDGHVYVSFLAILNMYRTKHKDTIKVYEDVTKLLVDHPDLLNDFRQFLPHSSTAISTREQNSLLHHDERGLDVLSARPSPIDKFRHHERIKVSHVDRKTNFEHRAMDDDKVAVRLHNEHVGHLHKDIRNRRCCNVVDVKGEQEVTRTLITQHHSDKKRSIRKAENFGSSASLCPDDDKLVVRSMYSQELSFFEKVKERLCNLDDYQAFLKCLHIYSSEIINRIELQRLMFDLLGKHPDLMEGFNEFLEKCENIGGLLVGVIDIKSIWNEGKFPKQDKDKEQRRETHYSEDDRNKDRCVKSIQELDLPVCQRCTPSYRLLPEEYPIPSASQRTELGAQVLNDKWVSLTSGSEDYSFKHMRRNQYEETLFRCEDDRYELDMIIESARSAVKSAEEFLANVNSNKINLNSPLLIEEHFSSLNLRFIERLYGDHGLDVVDILQRDVTIALPIILTRLKQKHEEWTRCRSDFNKVWAEVYAKNHYRSLDQRSFYFKQQDLKNLSAKSLISKIAEVKDNRLKQDDLLLHPPTGFRQEIFPDLELECSDMDIHDDLHALVKFSCEELQITNGNMKKAMKLWTTFLEPMLGVPYRSHSPDSLKGANVRGGKVNVANTGEGDGVSCQDALVMKTEEPFSSSKSEKEEGELSPDNDFGEENVERSNYQAFGKDTFQHADDDNSGNGFEVCEYVSASESAGDVLFLDGHETEKLHGKIQNGGEAGGLAEGKFVGAVSECFLSTAKPLVNHVPLLSNNMSRKNSRVFYGSDGFYVLFRLHLVLYERMHSAKVNATRCQGSGNSVPDSYTRFMDSLYGLLDGSSDNTMFEDDCRALIGNKSYVLFTLDKLIYKLVKQLQSVATDETDNKLLQLYEYENSRSPERLVDSIYYVNSRALLHEANIYRFEFSSSPACLSIQLMDSRNEDGVAAISMDPHFMDYLGTDLSVAPSAEPVGVFLQRNKRRYAGVDAYSALSMATDDAKVFNGLECEMARGSSKISYVTHTEDFFFRTRRGRFSGRR